MLVLYHHHCLSPATLAPFLPLSTCAAPSTNKSIQEYGILQSRLGRRASAHKRTTTKTAAAMPSGDVPSGSAACPIHRYAKEHRFRWEHRSRCRCSGRLPFCIRGAMKNWTTHWWCGLSLRISKCCSWELQRSASMRSAGCFLQSSLAISRQMLYRWSVKLAKPFQQS